jgi:hypothetical protein
LSTGADQKPAQASTIRYLGTLMAERDEAQPYCLRTLRLSTPVVSQGGQVRSATVVIRWDKNIPGKGKHKPITPSSGDCVKRLAQLPFFELEREVDQQVAAPAETRTPNLHRATKDRSSRVRREGWRQRRLGRRKTLLNERHLNRLARMRPREPATPRTALCSPNLF